MTFELLTNKECVTPKCIRSMYARDQVSNLVLISMIYQRAYVVQLTVYKEQCEWALDVKKIPHEVVIECLALREQRSNIDLVADVTESQLRKVYISVYLHKCIMK